MKPYIILHKEGNTGFYQHTYLVSVMLRQLMTMRKTTSDPIFKHCSTYTNCIIILKINNH